MKENTTTKQKKTTGKIDYVGVTTDTLTSRAGLGLYSEYIENSNIVPALESSFDYLRKSAKGAPIRNLFQQTLTFLADGTSSSISYFDQLKQDEGYAATIGCTIRELVSSHAVKRFFHSFHYTSIWQFRSILREMFVAQIRKINPKVIILGLDSMVMDNNDAKCREGNEPTYKKVLGLHPIQVTWNGVVVDAIFQSGSKHCHHEGESIKLVRSVVDAIRKELGEEVLIVLRADSGYMDQKFFLELEELGVAYIIGGKVYQEIQEEAKKQGKWEILNKGKEQEWEYVEFQDQRGSWEKSRRVVFSRLVVDEQQTVMDFSRLETVIYTNLGDDEKLAARVKKAEMEDLLKAGSILESYHSRGAEELVHRKFKEFASEQLPFKKFAANLAYYYTMLIGFYLMKLFQEEVCFDVVEANAYPNTIRRKIFDIAGKITAHADKITLRVTQAVMDALDFSNLWERCQQATQFA